LDLQFSVFNFPALRLNLSALKLVFPYRAPLPAGKPEAASLFFPTRKNTSQRDSFKFLRQPFFSFGETTRVRLSINYFPRHHISRGA
jgi:hypothetical protein